MISNQSDSSSPAPSRSTDSGNVSDSNSSKCELMSSNSSDVGEDQPRNSLTSIDSVQSDEVAEEKTPTTPKVRPIFDF